MVVLVLGDLMLGVRLLDIKLLFHLKFTPGLLFIDVDISSDCCYALVQWYQLVPLMQGSHHSAGCDYCYLLLCLVLNVLCALVHWYHSVPVKRRLGPGPTCISLASCAYCVLNSFLVAGLACVDLASLCCLLKCVLIQFWCCSIMNWDIVLVY
jgi:hypothetical protein